MALVVKKDEAANPIDVGLFGAKGIVFGTDGVADLFEEFFSAGLGAVCMLTCGFLEIIICSF